MMLITGGVLIQEERLVFKSGKNGQPKCLKRYYWSIHLPHSRQNGSGGKMGHSVSNATDYCRGSKIGLPTFITQQSNGGSPKYSFEEQCCAAFYTE